MIPSDAHLHYSCFLILVEELLFVLINVRCCLCFNLASLVLSNFRAVDFSSIQYLLVSGSVLLSFPFSSHAISTKSIYWALATCTLTYPGSLRRAQWTLATCTQPYPGSLRRAQWTLATCTQPYPGSLRRA